MLFSCYSIYSNLRLFGFYQPKLYFLLVIPPLEGPIIIQIHFLIKYIPLGMLNFLSKSILISSLKNTCSYSSSKYLNTLRVIMFFHLKRIILSSTLFIRVNFQSTTYEVDNFRYSFIPSIKSARHIYRFPTTRAQSISNESVFDSLSPI